VIETLTSANNVLLAPPARFSVRRRLLVLGLEFAALAVLLGAYSWVYLTHGLRLDALFHSDALYLPALMQDLLHDGGRYSDWNLTPSPYFFPDWPLFGVGFVITGGNFYYSVLAFTLIQLGLVFLLLRLIYAELFPDNRAPLFAFASTALLVSMAVDSVPIIDVVRVSAHHFGELSMILLAMWLSIRILRTSKASWLLTIALCLVAFLTGLSDALFVVHYAIPVLVAAEILWHRREIQGRQFCAIAVLPALSAFAGSRLTLSLMPEDHQVRVRFGMEYLDRNFDHIEALVTMVLKADVLPMVIIPMFYVASVGVVGLHLVQGRLKDNPGAFFALVLPLASSLSILGMALLIHFGIPSRYVTPAFVFPVALLFVPATIAKPLPGLAIGFAVGALAIGSIVVTVIPNGFDFRSTFYPAEVACLDRTLSERGLTYGISQYWTAKRVTALSEEDLKLVSVFPDLNEYHWINNSSWFRDSYDFAIVEASATPGYRLDGDKIRSLNGEPQFTAQCGEYSVLGYEPGGLVTSKPEP
jgi:hypothetical protein